MYMRTGRYHNGYEFRLLPFFDIVFVNFSPPYRNASNSQTVQQIKKIDYLKIVAVIWIWMAKLKNIGPEKMLISFDIVKQCQ